MAEIVRTETRVQRRHTLGGGEQIETIRIATVVRSFHGHSAGMLRDFAKALDSAEAPDSTVIEARRSTDGHLTGLAAQWSEDVDPPDPPAS